MGRDNFLFGLAHMFVIFLIFGLGSICLGFTYSPVIAQHLLRLFSDGTIPFKELGFMLISFGFLLTFLFILLHRKSYYKLSMKGAKVVIEEAIIKEYVEGYWKEIFHIERPDLKVIIHPTQRLEIVTKLPKAGDPEEVLKRIENELGVLLARKLGYEKEFTLTIHE